MKRAIATDYHPLNLWVADARYAYGTTAAPARTLERLPHGSRVFETGFDFGSGNQVIRLFTTDLAGEVFAVWKVTATNAHALARSTDYGSTFTDVLTFPAVNIYLLSRGLTVGYPNGVRTYAIAEYLAASGPQAVRILTSTDGINWTSQCSVTAGTASNIRHWHNIDWNPYNEHWYVCSGDTNAQSALIATQNLALITDAAPSTWGAIVGLQVAQGAQRNRTVEFLFTEDHTFTCSDTLSGGPSERGVWRWQHDLSFGEHVDTGDGRYTDGVDERTTMWTGVKAEGHLLFCSYGQNDIAGKRHLEIYGAEVGNDGPGQWREIARVYLRNGTTSDVRGFWYNDGLFGFCFGRGAGKATQNETAIFRLEGEFTDDLLATSAVNGKPIYIPDTIHPVYWLGGDGASDANSGYTPDEPWATFQYAMGGGVATGAAKNIASMTETSGTVLVILNGATHTWVAGDRVTFSGVTPAAYNNTFEIVSTTANDRFSIRIDSGTGNSTVQGAVVDTCSNVTYGGKIIVRGSHEVVQSFTANLSQFPYNRATSGVHGFDGEAGHPIFLSGEGSDATEIYANAATTGVSQMTLGLAGDFVIVEAMKYYNKRAATSSRCLYPNVAGTRMWARDAQIGHPSYSPIAWRAGTACDTVNYLIRCLIEGDTALGGANQPGVEADGTAIAVVLASIVQTTYRGVRIRTDGAGIVVLGSLVRNFALRGIDSVASNNASSWDVRGNVIVSADGATVGVDSGTGTLSGGFMTGGNFYDRTPSRARDQGGTNIDMQVLGTALTDYFVDGDPRLGLANDSPLIEAAKMFLGGHDYARNRRKNPSSVGHLEHLPATRPSVPRRPVAA
jgi:hypothetical protein